jgi:hypothetical protein
MVAKPFGELFKTDPVTIMMSSARFRYILNATDRKNKTIKTIEASL